MSEAKFPNITLILEERIADGTYQDRLPSVRSLIQEFGVANQTVIHALKPLIERNLILPSGRQGMRINRKQNHKNAGMLALVTIGDEANARAYKSNEILQNKITDDGYEVVVIATKQPMTLSIARKLLGQHYDGILFFGSSINSEIAEFFEAEKIPFVSCNQLYGYPRLNFVDFNGFTGIESLLKTALAQNIREITLFFPSQLENYDHFVRKSWLALKKRYQLPIMPYDRYDNFYAKSYSAQLMSLAQNCLDRKSYPELLICWGGLTQELLDVVFESKYRFPEQTMLWGLKGDDCPDYSRYQNRVKTIQPVDIVPVLLAGYQLLQQQIKSPCAKYVHKFLDYPVVINEN